MIIHSRQWSLCVLILFAGLLVSACDTGKLPTSSTQMVEGGEVLPRFTPTLTPFQPSPPTGFPKAPTPSLEISPDLIVDPGNNALFTPTAETFADPTKGVFIASYIPKAIRDELVFPAGYEFSADPEEALLIIGIGEGDPFSRWIFALVAPFPTIPDGVTISELRGAWQGVISATFPDVPILVDEQTHAVFEAAWGPSAQNAVKILPATEMAGYAWEHQPAWGIVPFEALEPRWKVLEVDGISPIRKEFNPDDYPLTIGFSMVPNDEGGAEIANQVLSLSVNIPSSNRHEYKMTTLAMTGVTALVRCTAYYMEQRGVTYPGQDVRDLLKDADILHISNEIPFSQECPFPNCFQEGLVFCSDPKYIELLTDIGTDIVELTGDHFADWGPEAMLYTLEIYREHGIPYYGGGANWDEGSQAIILEHNGNRLAFIGCNGKGGWYATARVDNPGAVSCDFETMHTEIARLRSEGYLPIATFQHYEYYTYLPQPNMQEDFRGMANAGALIVSGSQAHQPHGMEILGEAFLHYGLGNMFFDQFGYCPGRACDDAFIDRHVFYNGRYISTELIPIKFIDWARPRPMTPEEKETFLEIIFTASGW